MRLERLRDGWNRLGTIDPMWAILSDARKLGNLWQEDEFFATGKREIDTELGRIASLVGVAPQGKALDFGCGIGRLSRALCTRFDEVVGVDIAASMIDRARSLNQHPDRCRFELNERDDLAMFDDASFDFIYSSITLQHVSPKLASRYLDEFSRILRVGGILSFQIPLSPPKTARYVLHRVSSTLLSYMPRPLIDAYRRLKYPQAGEAFVKAVPRVLMEMHGLSQRAIDQSFHRGKMIRLDARRREDAGPGWKTYTYTYMRLGTIDLS